MKIVINFDYRNYYLHPLKITTNDIPFFRTYISMALALGILGIFISWNAILTSSFKYTTDNQDVIIEREHLPDTNGLTSTRLAIYNFESANADDTASHIAKQGHHGKQSLRMSSKVPFSPGLWIKCKDLHPGDASWIRVTGYVWFSCPVSEAKCSLVVTCNHTGINYKYMYIPIEKEVVNRDQWNKISIDYLIPPVPDHEDVVQAYFWYRGKGEMLVDDIEIEIYTPPNKNH